MKENKQSKLYDDIAKGKEADGNKVVASLYDTIPTETDGNKLLKEVYYENTH